MAFLSVLSSFINCKEEIHRFTDTTENRITDDTVKLGGATGKGRRSQR